MLVESVLSLLFVSTLVSSVMPLLKRGVFAHALRALLIGAAIQTIPIAFVWTFTTHPHEMTYDIFCSKHVTSLSVFASAVLAMTCEMLVIVRAWMRAGQVQGLMNSVPCFYYDSKLRPLAKCPIDLTA